MLRISFLIIISLVNYKCEPKITRIDGKFQFCVATDSLIEVSRLNTDFQLFNQLSFLKNFHKEFVVIKLFTNEIMNVYSLSGNLFFANCTEVGTIYVPLMQPKCGRDLLVFKELQGSREYFFNHKTNIIAEDTIYQSCDSIKKKFYLESYAITQIANKINIKILKSMSKELKVKHSFRNEIEMFKNINNTLESIKNELKNRTNNTVVKTIVEHITPLPLKHLASIEEAFNKMIKEREIEVSDKLTKFFIENILNKKVFMGMTIILIYIIFGFIIFRILYINFVKVVKILLIHPKNNTCWKKYLYETKTEENDDKKNSVIVEMREENLCHEISEKDLFWNSFFKSFAILSEKECFEKIRLQKKLPKNCLIQSDEVIKIRKGIDCTHDIDFIEVSKFFNTYAKQHLEEIIAKFNGSDYFCPICKNKLTDTTVYCEKCGRWFHVKCVKNVFSGPWFCYDCKR